MFRREVAFTLCGSSLFLKALSTNRWHRRHDRAGEGIRDYLGHRRGGRGRNNAQFHNSTVYRNPASQPFEPRASSSHELLVAQEGFCQAALRQLLSEIQHSGPLVRLLRGSRRVRFLVEKDDRVGPVVLTPLMKISGSAVARLNRMRSE